MLCFLFLPNKVEILLSGILVLLNITHNLIRITSWNGDMMKGDVFLRKNNVCWIGLVETFVYESSHWSRFNCGGSWVLFSSEWFDRIMLFCFVPTLTRIHVHEHNNMLAINTFSHKYKLSFYKNTLWPNPILVWLDKGGCFCRDLVLD